MRSRCTLVAIAVVAVLVGAPLAMALDGCAGMGAMCDGPCGVSCATVSASPTLHPLQVIADLSPTVMTPPLPVVAPSLEPPPKLALRSL